MDNQQPTNQDLAKAIKKLSKTTQDILCSVNKSFSEIEQKIATKDELKALETRMTSKEDLKALEIRIDKKFDNMDKKFDRLEDKFAETRGDLISLFHKEDNKFSALVGKLLKHKVLPTKSIREVLAMEPFPQSL